MPSMPRLYLSSALLSVSFVSTPVQAAPRDATAVLLHCGNATLGDTTIYEPHTVAGGRRILKYLAGTLNFNRVGNDGWTFVDGSHGKHEHQTAEQMGRQMPCVAVALANSAAAAPLAPVSTAERVETSMKRPYEKLIVSSMAILALLTAAYFIWGRTPEPDMAD